MKLLRFVGCPLALTAAMLFTVGCGGGEEEASDSAENKTPTATSSDPVAKSDTSTETEGEMVLVSLELPGMTWAGCEASVQSALANVPEIKELNTNPTPAGGTATFKVAKGFDFASKLNEFALGGNEHIAGWKEVN